MKIWNNQMRTNDSKIPRKSIKEKQRIYSLKLSKKIERKNLEIRFWIVIYKAYNIKFSTI